MQTILELYGSLVLTVLGFVLPIFTILLSLFSEGVKVLTTKYENEKKQSEDNLISETEKRRSEKGLDYEALEETARSLRKKKKTAETRLAYLKPLNMTYKIGVPFGLSFICLLIALGLSADTPVQFLIALSASFVIFIRGIYVLWISLSVLTEVSEAIHQKKTGAEEKMIELLSILVEKSGTDNLYIKPGEASVFFDNKRLKEDSTFEFVMNKKYQIPVSINNASEKMAKQIEAGFIFSKDFLIEETDNLSLHTSENEQIVRFNVDNIQSHENNLQDDITVTCLKAGTHDVRFFLKGENVKYHTFTLKIKVIE